MSRKYVIGVDPANGGGVTVVSLVGESGVFDGFIVPYEWDLNDVLIRKGLDGDNTDEASAGTDDHPADG